MFPKETRILICDDMVAMRQIVNKALRQLGFSDIQEADDGLKGWDVLSKSNPPIQLIVSDWNMPNCTGLAFLTKVRADTKFQRVPFILLTAEVEVSQVAEAIKLGVSNYIVKPFTVATLQQKLEVTHQRISKAQAA